MTLKQEQLLENKVRKIVEQVLTEESTRSYDKWKELVDIIELNGLRPSNLSQKYFGQEIFDALDNLLIKIKTV